MSMPMTVSEPIPFSAANASRSPEIAMRPKVLRRPAHLSVVAQSTNTVSEPPALLVPTLAPSLSRPWQDDGRFAIVLLAMIVMLNLLFTLWLSGLHHAAPNNANPTRADMASGSIHVLDNGVTEVTSQ